MADAQNPTVSTEAPERVNQIFAGVGAAIGLPIWLNLFSLPFVVASLVVAKTLPRLGVWLGFLGMLTVLPGVVWVARSAWGEQWRRAFPLARVGVGVLVWSTLCVLAFFPVLFAWFAALERTIGLPNLSDPVLYVGVLGVVIGGPLAEEVLFRGYGLARIRELGGEKRALLFTALAFALAHGSWVKLPGTFALGLFVGWLVLRTGSLWPALLCHVVNNGMSVFLGRFETGPFMDPKQVPWILIGTVGAAGLVCLGLLWSPQVRGRISGLNVAP